MRMNTSRQHSVPFIGFLLNWISRHTFIPSPSIGLGFLFLLIPLQWKPSHTFVNNVAIDRRKLTERCILHLFQSAENDNQNALEEAVHLSNDDYQRREVSDGEINGVILDEISLNPGANYCVTDRNRQKPTIQENLVQNDENFKHGETPFIAIEDFDWFEPSLEKIEQKYEKRKKQLNLSLTLDRKSNSVTVPFSAHEMLDKVLRDEMNSEIKLKYGKMKFERAKFLVNNKDETLSLRKVAQMKQEFSRNKYGISTTGHKEDQSVLPVSVASNLHVADSKKESLLKTKMLSVKRDIQKNRIKGRYWPGDHIDWKKLQEIRTHVKEQTSDWVINEDEVERKFLEWKKFIFTQDIAIEEILQEQEHEKKIDINNRREVRGKNTREQIIQEQNLNIICSVSIEDEAKAEEDTNSIRDLNQDPEVQEVKPTFSNLVKDINCSSLRALEKLSVKQLETFERTDLKNIIRGLKDSLDAVDFVDIKMDKDCDVENEKEGNDVTIDFTDIFPVQAAKMKKEVEFKAEENVRVLDHRIEYSRERDFSTVEELMRNDIMSSISNKTEIKEECLLPPPHPSFFREKVMDEIDDAKSLGETNKEPTFLSAGKNDRHQPPNTPFFNSMQELKNKPTMSEKGYEREKSNGIAGSDINMPPEERNTTLLGTFEEQWMQNFYRTAKATTEEDQEKARKNYKNFQHLQQKKMEQLGNIDLAAAQSGRNKNSFIKNGDVDMEKLHSLLEANRKSLDDDMNKEQEAGFSEKNDQEDVSNECHHSEINSTSKFTTILNKNSEDKRKIDIRGKNFIFREGSDINSSPEKRSTVLLGTFEQQKMNNLYRESGIENEDEKELFNRKYKELLQRKEEGMKKLDTVNDERDDLKFLLNDDGELDTQKVFSWIEEKRRNIEDSEDSSSSAKVDTTTGEELRMKRGEPANNLEKNDERPATYAQYEQSSAQDQQGIPGRRSDPESFEIRNKNTSSKSGLYSNNVLNNVNILKSNASSDSEEVPGEKVEKERDDSLGQEYVSAKECMKGRNAAEEDSDKNRRRIEEMVKSESSSRDFYKIFGSHKGEYDYDDYRKVEYELVRDENADLSTYKVRKKMLVDLKVFSKHEVDMLMDMKDRIELKGVSAHMARLRKPFKEFGAIFRFEGVIVDLSDIQKIAWRRVAEELNLRKPSDDNLRYASVQNPEYAVRRIFYWTDNYQFSTHIGKIYNKFLREEVEASSDGLCAVSNQQLEKASSSSGKAFPLPLTEGVKSWISALFDVEMPVALVSYLDDETVSTLLNVTGLADFFPRDRRVTKTNGLNRDSYLQLAACLNLDRRPDSCLLFEANMVGLGVARENDLRSVGLTTIYPMYELQAADTTVKDFNYMTAMNIRRIFGERTYHEPLTMPDSPMCKIQKRKVLTIYPGDEHGELYGDESDGTGGGKNNGKGFVQNNMRYNNDINQERYYGEDNYSPLSYNDIHEDGLLYDQEEENNLFQ